MLKYMRTIFLILVVVSLVNCSRNSGPLPTKKLLGINDSAIYHLDKDGRTAGVQTLQWSNDGPNSYLHRDTVDLGDDFIVYFSIFEDEFEIAINEPTRVTLTKVDQPKIETERPFLYRFKASKTGVYNFKGEFRYDSIVLPIEWRFIVVDRD
jgi:hypothetical protein